MPSFFVIPFLSFTAVNFYLVYLKTPSPPSAHYPPIRAVFRLPFPAFRLYDIIRAVKNNSPCSAVSSPPGRAPRDKPPN